MITNSVQLRHHQINLRVLHCSLDMYLGVVTGALSNGQAKSQNLDSCSYIALSSTVFCRVLLLLPKLTGAIILACMVALIYQSRRILLKVHVKMLALAPGGWLAVPYGCALLLHSCL